MADQVHQHYFTRENGEGPFVCSCGATRDAPAHRVSAEFTHTLSDPVDSHAQIGWKRARYLWYDVAPHFSRDEFAGIFHRHTNAQAISIINTLLAERHPDPCMPGIHEDGAELRWLAKHYGVHLKREDVGGKPRPGAHVPHDMSHRDDDWERWLDRRDDREAIALGKNL